MKTPRIKRIRLWTLRIPLPHAVYLGRLRIEHREFAVAQIESNTGLTGWGATLTRDKPVEQAAQQRFLPVLLGQELTQDDQLWEKMMCAANEVTHRDGVMRALSILDIASWDLRAKIEEMPLLELLGGKTSSVDVLVVGGYRAEDESPEALLSEIDYYRLHHVRNLKLMYTPDEMISRSDLLVRVRQRIGDDAMFGNDFIGNGRDVATIVSALERVKDAKMDFIEDPFPTTEILNYLRLRKRIRCRIMAGETVEDYSGAKDLLAARVLDVARWDATVCGGITGWLKLQTLAAQHGMSVCPHVFPEIHTPLAAATNQQFVEATISPYDTMNFSAVVDHPLKLHNGKFLISERAGLGVEFVPEKAKTFMINNNMGGAA